MSKEEGDKRNKDNPWQQQKRGYQDKEEDMKLWGIVVFGLIGATFTTLAVSLFAFFGLLLNFLAVRLRIWMHFEAVRISRFLSMLEISYRLSDFEVSFSGHGNITSLKI